MILILKLRKKYINRPVVINKQTENISKARYYFFIINKGIEYLPQTQVF